jgi:glycine/D-amino acid oxidase-like deaminating enzyme
MTQEVTLARSATKRRVASARDIQRALEDINDNHLACRDFGHNWRQYAVKKAKGGFERSLFCKQCKTARHQFITSRGEVAANNYSYAEGYQFKGMGRIHSEGKGIIRLAAIERAMDGRLIETPDTPVGNQTAG